MNTNTFEYKMDTITFEYNDFDTWYVKDHLDIASKLIYELAPYVKVIAFKEDDKITMYLEVCESKLYTLYISDEKFEKHFYEFKYDVSRRMKNIHRHIGKALDVSLGENI